MYLRFPRYGLYLLNNGNPTCRCEADTHQDEEADNSQVTHGEHPLQLIQKLIYKGLQNNSHIRFLFMYIVSSDSLSDEKVAFWSL